MSEGNKFSYSDINLNSHSNITASNLSLTITLNLYQAVSIKNFDNFEPNFFEFKNIFEQFIWYLWNDLKHIKKYLKIFKTKSI